MGVLAFYLLALVPVVIGAAIWYHDKEVVWLEWLAGTGIAFAYTGIVHLLCITGMTHDVETLSGRVTHATFYPEWVEQYLEAHTRTVGSGDDQRTETYYTTEYRTHHKHWEASCAFGIVDHAYAIDRALWQELSQRFGGEVVTESAWKPGFYSGDPDVHVSHNHTGYLQPVTCKQAFKNRVKAAPSLFSFAKVPKGTKVYAWPENEDHFQSSRLLGTAANLIDAMEFDQLNSRLGPIQRVNLILVGFVDEGPEHGQLQEAAWIGGKKNDLVITFGGMTRAKPATWVHAFGWTESDLCKRNLESLFLRLPASTNLLVAVEREVRANYQLKDWTKFDYLTVEPPTWAYVVFILGLVLTQGGLYLYFHSNELSQ